MKARKNQRWKSRFTSLLICLAVMLTSIQFPATPVKADELPASPAERTITTSGVDDSKQYCIIKSRSNGKVLTANGVSAIVQKTYVEGLEQYFTKETVDDGYFVLRNANCNQVIAVANKSANNGAKIVLEEYNASNKYQQWSLQYCSQGFYALVNRGSGKVIDVPAAATGEDVQMQQYGFNGSNAQQWDIVDVNLKALMQAKAKPDLSTVNMWKLNVLKSPLAKKLTAAGPIFIEWYTGGGIGEIFAYEIIFDGVVQGTVVPSNAEIMEYEIYSTAVSAHTVAVNAILKNGTKIIGNEQKFYVTKKGIGWDTLYRTQEMNLSWYYNWSWTPSAGTDKNLPFIPMIWGNWGSEWLANQNNRDNNRFVLAFNEPDFQTQSNVLVEDAIKAWPEFKASGLRLGSPCTAIPAIYTDVAYVQESSKGWFYKFMDAVGDDVDFIVLHDYDESGNAEAFLEMVDKTWEKWHKPIWISEFGVACWTAGRGWDKSKKDNVYEFMEKVIPELDKRAYVERYAWFPFDPNDEWGGASGIFDYDTGQLNELGQLYAKLGLPDGYGEPDDEVNPAPDEDVVEEKDMTPIIAVTAPSKTILVNQSKQAKAIVTGATASVIWTSSNAKVATVNKAGVVKGVAAGKTTITATVGSSKASFVITVKKPTIKWNVSKAPLQLKKSTTAVKAAGLQAEDKIKSYTSSNKKVVTVSPEGKITAKKVGIAKITATTKYGAKATVTIKVQKNAVKITSISVNKSSVSLKKGKTFQLETTKHHVTSLYNVKYMVANKKIATVSAKGKITAKKKGTTYVTVKCQNQTKKIKVKVYS